MDDSKKPVQVPKDVLEGLEALRRHHGTDLLDIATIRYPAIERGRQALTMWVHRHPDEYGRGLLDGFRIAEE